VQDDVVAVHTALSNVLVRGWSDRDSLAVAGGVRVPKPAVACADTDKVGRGELPADVFVDLAVGVTLLERKSEAGIVRVAQLAAVLLGVVALVVVGDLPVAGERLANVAVSCWAGAGLADALAGACDLVVLGCVVDIEVARAVRMRLGAAFGAECGAFVRVVVRVEAPAKVASPGVGQAGFGAVFHGAHAF
jgi:hypothetical protein